MAIKIHNTAVIDKRAAIGKNVEIAPYAVIGENVVIGDGTFIGPHSVIEHAVIGRNNYLSAHVFIGFAPQDFKYKGERTKVLIGDNNIIREGVSIHRGSASTKVTIIGSGCMFMANSHAGHDCRIGNNVIMTNSAAAAGHVEIEDNAIISGLSAIHQFVRIGRLCMISGGAMVNQDIIPYTTAQGDRARPVCLNVVGLKRNGINAESIRSIKRAFRILFFENLSLEKALAKIRSENLSPEARHIADFCESSRRGIARPTKQRGEK